MAHHSESESELDELNKSELVKYAWTW